MKKIVGAFLVAGALFGCGGGNVTPPPVDAGVQPIGVNFTVTDPNMVYNPGDLSWKGSFYWTIATHALTFDSSWSGGNGSTTQFPVLDGGAVTGVWTVDATWVPTVAETFSYGLIDNNSYDATAVTYADGGTPVVNTSGEWGWLPDNNGQLVLTADQTSPNPAVAQGMTYPTFGGSDIILTLDTTSLDPTPIPLSDGGTTTWAALVADGGAVSIKYQLANWDELTLNDDGTMGDQTAGDGVYTFDVASWTGAGAFYPHTSTLSSSSMGQFVWNIAGNDYKNSAGNTFGFDGGSGVGVYTNPNGVNDPGGTNVQQTPALDTVKGNTQFTVP